MIEDTSKERSVCVCVCVCVYVCVCMCERKRKSMCKWLCVRSVFVCMCDTHLPSRVKLTVRTVPMCALKTVDSPCNKRERERERESVCVRDGVI